MTGNPFRPTKRRAETLWLRVSTENPAEVDGGPDTATPDWHGERLDLGYAIDVLWRPRTDSGVNAEDAPV